MLNLFIKFVLTVLLFGSAIALNLSLFKIHIEKYHKRIAFIALVTGFVNFYMKFILHSQLFFPAQLVVMIVLLTALMDFPFFYSLLMVLVGNLAFAVFDGILSTTAINSGLSSYNLIINDIWHFSALHIITTVVYIIIAILLRKLNIGFAFVSTWFDKFLNRPSNYLWGALLTVFLIVGQIILHQVVADSINLIFMIILALLLLLVLLYAYLQTKDIIGNKTNGK